MVDVVNDPTTEVDLTTARIQSNPFIEVGDTLSIPQQPAPPSLGVRSGTDRNGAEVSASHILGTDPLGRDILSQLLYSTRAAFFLGMIAAVVTVFIATAIGSISAYFGGWIDTLLMRFADLILLVPLLPVLIVVSALFRDQPPAPGSAHRLAGGVRRNGDHPQVAGPAGVGQAVHRCRPDRRRRSYPPDLPTHRAQCPAALVPLHDVHRYRGHLPRGNPLVSWVCCRSP